MKLDSSSDTDSSSENTSSFSEEKSDNVTFYRWKIVEKKITKSKVDVTFKDAAEMFKDDTKTLKEYMYIKRSYKNDKQDAIQSAYFGNPCFRIFAACCYAESPNNNDVRNDNVIVVTETSDHDKVESMSCLQKLSTWSNICIKKHTRIFMLEVMEWGHNLDLTTYST